MCYNTGMDSKTNSSEYGAIVRAELEDDRRGTHPGTSPGFVHRSSGKVPFKVRRAPQRPLTTKHQTRPTGDDITGIGSNDDPSVDPKRIPDDQIELGIRMIEEINARGLAQEDVASDPVERVRAVLGSRARTHGGMLLALAKDTPKTTPEA